MGAYFPNTRMKNVCRMEWLSVDNHIRRELVENTWSKNRAWGHQFAIYKIKPTRIRAIVAKRNKGGFVRFNVYECHVKHTKKLSKFLSGFDCLEICHKDANRKMPKGIHVVATQTWFFDKNLAN